MSTPEESKALTASFYRCRTTNGGGSFTDSFYEFFLAKSPEIAAMFAHTDFEKQKLMLRQSLLEMICFDLGLEGTREELQRLGRRHAELNVTDEMYSMWLDALCEAIEKHDPQYSPQLETLWRDAMTRSMKEMRSLGGED